MTAFAIISLGVVVSITGLAICQRLDRIKNAIEVVHSIKEDV